jgi:hypothetical protein
LYTNFVQTFVPPFITDTSCFTLSDHNNFDTRHNPKFAHVENEALKVFAAHARSAVVSSHDNAGDDPELQAWASTSPGAVEAAYEIFSVLFPDVLGEMPVPDSIASGKAGGGGSFMNAAYEDKADQDLHNAGRRGREEL